VVRDLEVACLRAGIERHITPHGLRHGWAQLAYTRNVALDRIQKILGHSSLLVTAAYIEKARGLDMKAATLSALWG
jgi:integrase